MYIISHPWIGCHWSTLERSENGRYKLLMQPSKNIGSCARKAYKIFYFRNFRLLREIYLEHGNKLNITQDRTSLISQVVCGKLQRKKLQKINFSWSWVFSLDIILISVMFAVLIWSKSPWKWRGLFFWGPGYHFSLKGGPLKSHRKL